MSTKNVVSLYTEITPNPATLKFVANKLIYPSRSIEITKSKNTEVSPLAQELFSFPFIESLFIAANFITVTKKDDAVWGEISSSVKACIQNYLEGGKPVIYEEKLQSEKTKDTTTSDNKGNVVQRIEEILDNYVKPAVEMDGGAIQLKKYENGKVYVTLHGACNGCPSSSITLKAGIETMMKRMVPEVREVIAD